MEGGGSCLTPLSLTLFLAPPPPFLSPGLPATAVYAPHTSPLTSRGSSGDFFAVVTSGARAGPGSGEGYAVALHLTCRTADGADVRADPSAYGYANGYANGYDQGDPYRSSSGARAHGGGGGGSRGLLSAGRFARRLETSPDTPPPTGTAGPTPPPTVSSAPSVSTGPSPGPTPAPSLGPTVSLQPSSTPTPDRCATTEASCGAIVFGNTSAVASRRGVAGAASSFWGACSPVLN